MSKWICVAGMLLVGACQQSETASVVAKQLVRPAPQTLTLNAKAVRLQGALIVDGSTNLPDGTLLTVTLKDIHGHRILAQSDATVRNASYGSDQFTDHSEAWPSGQYTAQVTTSSSDIQPDPVKVAVGKNYANFTGPLLITGAGGSRTVRLVQKVTASAH